MRTSHTLTLQAATALLLTGTALLLAGCVSPAPDVSEADLVGKNVRECRYSEGAGSNMRRRICASQEQWAAFDAAEQEQNTDDFFRQVREEATLTGNVATPGIRGF
jgi:hypothetical protein